MNECRIISYVVPEGPPYYVNGTMRAVHRCEVHNFDVADPYAAGDLCPIGRIEKATDEAIEKINAAKNCGLLFGIR